MGLGLGIGVGVRIGVRVRIRARLRVSGQLAAAVVPHVEKADEATRLVMHGRCELRHVAHLVCICVYMCVYV